MTTNLEESARLAGSHAWMERRLFEILGGWVATTSEHAAKLLFDRHSSHHAWRARQWWDRLPVLADTDRQALAGSAVPAMAPALEQLAGLDTTVARLAGAYRFALPRLWSGYQSHVGSAGGPSDGSSLRTLQILLPDVTSDWQEGEALLQNLLAGRDEVLVASSTVEALEVTLLQ